MTNKGRPLTANEASRPVTTEPKATEENWHDEQTRQAVSEADSGDFAPAEDVKAIIRKYVRHG